MPFVKFDYSILEYRLLAAYLNQGGFAVLVIEFLESVEAVAAKSHDLAGLGYAVESFGKSEAGPPCSLLLCSVVQCSSDFPSSCLISKNIKMSD